MKPLLDDTKHHIKNIEVCLDRIDNTIQSIRSDIDNIKQRYGKMLKRIKNIKEIIND